MFSFESLKSANKKVKEKTQENKELSDEYYEKGYKLIEEYFSNNKEQNLKSAAELFFRALEHYKKNGKAYFGLSYIFYLFKKDDLCFEYLQVAEELEPEYEKTIQFKSKLKIQ